MNIVIIDEFIPDWLPGIKDSMMLDSGQEVCSVTVNHNGKNTTASVNVYGDVKVFFREDIYKTPSHFPPELQDYFAGKRPDLKDEVEVINNNWFELFFSDDPNNGIVLDCIDDDTVDSIREWLLEQIRVYLIERQCE